jgi:type I restriction enzyme S subunit
MEEAFASQEFPVFRCACGLLPAYARLLTQRPELWEELALLSKGIGGRRERLHPQDFLKIHVLLPPMVEQVRIVDLIGAIDDVLAAAERAQLAARKLAARLRSHMFERITAESSPIKVSEMFQVTLGRQKSARQSVGEHVIPYIRAANIMDGTLRLDDLQTMNFTPIEQSRFNLKPGDVLVVEGGSIGQSAMWSGQIAGSVGFDKHVIRLRSIPNKSIPEYAFQWARWAYESGSFARRATGITIKALGFARASSMEVPEIDVERQQQITRVLSSADKCTRQLQDQVQDARTLRSELLNALLTGEHAIPESYDELLGEVSDGWVQRGQQRPGADPGAAEGGRVDARPRRAAKSGRGAAVGRARGSSRAR